MATLSSIPSPCIDSAILSRSDHHQPLFSSYKTKTRVYKSMSVRAQAVKLPAGVENPRTEPKFTPPFQGFTKTAEIWNSRACMIGLIGTFILELILHKGILEMIGVEIGKGLDIPL